MRTSYHGTGTPIEPARALIEAIERDRAGFGQPVHVEDRDVEPVLELEHEIARRGGADDDPDGVVARHPARSGCFIRMRSISPMPLNAVTPSWRHWSQNRLAEKRRLMIDLRADDHRGDRRHVLGVGVEQREHRQQHVVLAIAGHLGGARAEVDVVVVGQHDTLRGPGRAAGEQDRCRLMGRDVERLNRCLRWRADRRSRAAVGPRWRRPTVPRPTPRARRSARRRDMAATWPRNVSSTITIRAPVVLRMCEMPGPRAAS